MTGAYPHNVIFSNRFKHRRRADCQNEQVPYPISLTERLKRINDGLGAGMTLADVQNEYDADQSEAVIQRWAEKLAVNPRRGTSHAAAFLRSLADQLDGGKAA